MRDMTDDLPPVIVGSAGLTGRTQIVRQVDLEEPVDFEEDGTPIYRPSTPSKAMPPNCLRVLSSPLSVDRGGGCNHDCGGRQRDGGCLAEVVRRANAAGVEWQFEVNFDRHGNPVWDYVGPDLP